MVELLVANEKVAGSSPVSRSNFLRVDRPDRFFGGVAKWLRRRSAKPLFTGSNPVAASIACRGGGIGRRKGLKIPWALWPVPVRFRPSVLFTGVEIGRFFIFGFGRLAQLVRVLA